MGFLFLVLYPLLLPASRLSSHHPPTHTHSLTLSLSLTHSPAFCVAGAGLGALHITYITNCLVHPVHISLTHYQSDTPVHAHTYIHTNSSTITPPSLSYFLFPCCFSMLSLSLVKLLTCGVIRSFIFWLKRMLCKENGTSLKNLISSKHCLLGM